MFFAIVILLSLGNLLWWTWADGRARRVRHAHAWRLAVAAFMLFQFAYLAYFLIAPVAARQSHHWMPSWMLALLYIWQLFVLPVAVLAIAFTGIGRGIVWLMKGHPTPPVAQSPADVPPPDAMSRRDVLTAAAIAAPPIVAFGLTGFAMRQLGELRVRRFEIAVADLPPNLDGMTIAHVTDVHIGRFTRTGALARVVETTNQLRADLVLFTGDLIDLSLSDLPAGINMLRRLDPRHGLAVIEGNHDLFESRSDFESRLRDAGVPLLLDESTLRVVRGEPVQLLGIRWGRTGAALHHPGDEVINDAVTRVAALRVSGAFPILLAHHPHAFDPAARADLPLTLAGHTHGGQLMLTDRLGAGPVMFRYWSGLYRKTSSDGRPSSLVVSNGAGNWFPLRVNAPAEIVHITLRPIPHA